ncbi:hypothetical protein F66182_7743 [Fusarium sp. NRRL 66182]|nr:hypothetical protein F66182_7743 [Fusarium sp. NRRL 66182]
MPSLIKTKLVVISDTHGLQFEAGSKPLPSVDVAIHCGDLTADSKLFEFQEAIKLLKEIDAPLKIVIAGNHDFSLDHVAFEEKIDEANRLAQEDLGQSIKKEYGDCGEARQLLQDAKHEGILFLEEGSHELPLHNGAMLRVYASPYTPATGSSSGWGFQYNGAHDFAIEKGTDIVITHGPPHGVMDMTTSRERVGCPQLFAAVARAQPRLHCFGHVHNSWGAKLVTWRSTISDHPSHFSDIDHQRSQVIESLLRLKGTCIESAEDREARQDRVERYRLQRCCRTSHCENDERRLGEGKTLFVNAAVMGDDELSQHPWLVDLELDSAESGSGICNESDGTRKKRKGSGIALPGEEDLEQKKPCR